MNSLGFSRTLSAAGLFLVLSSAVAPLGCSSSTTSSHPDGGLGGASAASGGTTGSAGSTGAGGGIGGRGGATDAGSDARASGAGGTIVIVDGSGTNYTCAQLLACCNSTTNVQAKTACIGEYNAVSPGGDAACNPVLASIKASLPGQCP
jgi:hypothetical protein